MQIVNLAPEDADPIAVALIRAVAARNRVRVAIDTDGFKIDVGDGTWSAGHGVVGTRTVAPDPAPDHNDIRAEAWQEGYDLGLEDGINDANNHARNPYFRYCESPYNPCPFPAETGRRLCPEHRKAFEKLLAPKD